MPPRALLLTLFSLLAFAACTSAPAITPTAAPTVTPIQPTLTHTPVPSTATETALPPTETVTPSPLPPTETPTIIVPTETPEAWRIVFLGKTCPITVTSCDPFAPSEDILTSYSVRNNGKELQLLNQVIPNLPPSLPQIRFSPSGERLAYREQADLFVVNSDGTEVRRFDVGQIPDIRDFDFLGETCLILYITNSTSPTNHVTVDRICVEQSEPQRLAEIDFPSEPYRRRFYKISPQGDKLLAYVQTAEGGDISLYVKVLGEDDPPHQLFHSPTRECKFRYQPLGPFKWHANGEGIELLWTSLCDNQSENVFYQMSWEGEGVTIKAMFPGIIIQGGDWSPSNGEFAFWYYPLEGGSVTIPGGDISGLYLLNFKTKTWKLTLPEFLVEEIVAWPVETDS